MESSVYPEKGSELRTRRAAVNFAAEVACRQAADDTANLGEFFAPDMSMGC